MWNILLYEKKFKEYHQFSEDEFKQLWKDCLFVLDTNTLLNMYRYSRKTVEAYFKVLNELKRRKQLWIPYQVGYEFYENRIDVIAEYEGSYDSILAILDKAKNDIETKYKDHPFLDLCDIKKKIETGLSGVDRLIKTAKKEHPKWMDKDDVLDQINSLFENNIGSDYDAVKLAAIKKEGQERYEKKIPPGYKDDKKSDEKKFGDLILWFQIIDQAKKEKKSIILVSGDVKEDWWLEKDGKRLMPLPQLKKEMFEKAGAQFHIYTADRFLEYYTKDKGNDIDTKAITEVRKVRELEEKRMMARRNKLELLMDREKNSKIFERHSILFLEIFDSASEVLLQISQEDIHPRYKEEAEHLFRRLKMIRNRLLHGEMDNMLDRRFEFSMNEILFLLEKLSHSDGLRPEVSLRLRNIIEKLMHVNLHLRNLIT